MDNLNIDLYLVPYDFTTTTEQAFKFALNLAHKGGGRIMLAHIVKKGDQVSVYEKKLSGIISKLSAEDQAIVEAKVIEGNVFSDINKIANTVGASVIVMGTHGSSGLKKIFGSDALKVVSNSNVPFILTQEGQEVHEINDIVMPFSFARESVQVTQVAASLAKKYDATIHLVGYRDKDEWLLRDMRTNQAIVRKHLNEHGIKYNIANLPNKEGYEKELMAYARIVDADLIAAAYFSQGIRGVFHSFIEAMIANDDKIPIITINAPEVMAVTSGFSFLTT
ncbi:MAG: universal stress protein [Crocinitomicaceae bacterium]|nr:universal stress protein [Crocinitomicaceae bacterium]